MKMIGSCFPGGVLRVVRVLRDISPLVRLRMSIKGNM